MGAIYQNLRKTRTIHVEKRHGKYVIVESDIWENSVGKIGSYDTQEMAEKELKEYAEDVGFRFIKRVDDDD